jgi:hypothetical protein
MKAVADRARPDDVPAADADASHSGSRETITLKQVAERACARIAPTWPLDRFIAVNPFWSLTDEPLPTVASRLASLSGARLLMPRAWYRAEWRAGRLRIEHLREAIAQSGATGMGPPFGGERGGSERMA